MAALVLYVTLAFRSYRWCHDISTSYSYCTEFISFSHHPGKRLHTHTTNTLHTSTPHSLYQELINLWSIFSNQLTLSPWQPPFSPPSSAIHYTKLLRPVCVCVSLCELLLPLEKKEAPAVCELCLQNHNTQYSSCFLLGPHRRRFIA